MKQLDSDAQPRISKYNENLRMNRAVNELIGMLRGIIADGEISVAETDVLAKWMLQNREVVDVWPVEPLASRLNAIYADGVVSDEEREDLRELVSQLVGTQDQETGLFTPTDLPLTQPPPDVIFDGNEFVLTGKFLYGSRKTCQKQIELLGGRCSENVRLQTSYVVIGSLMSRDWKFSTHGTKIQKAVEYSGRCPMALISEKHWLSYLLTGSSAKPQ